MVAYSFQARFAEPILDGRKGGTIRADRRRHAIPGEELQLYTGMRTRHCRLIARKPCLAVEPILVDFMVQRISIGVRLCLSDFDELNAFARFDGFADFSEMAEFWRETHRAIFPRGGLFDGWHIRWAPLAFAAARRKAG